MYTCDICSLSFTTLRSLQRHKKSVHEKHTFVCGVCAKSYTRKTNLNRHVLNDHPGDSEDALSAPSTSRGVPRKRRLSSSDSESSSPKRVASPDHQSHQWEEVAALRDVVSANRLTLVDVETDPVKLLNYYKTSIEQIIANKLKFKKGLKWYLTIRARFTRLLGENDSEAETFPYFRSVTNTTVSPESISGQISSSIRKIDQSMTEFEDMGSGWILDRILFIQINIIAYAPLVGGTFIELPVCLARKKALVNIKTTDDKCFLWCVLAALHPVPRENNPNLPRHYARFENELDLCGITFPFELNSRRVKKFEEANNVSVNIFGFEEDLVPANEIFPLYISAHKVEESRQVDLLLLTEGPTKHFCLIKSLSRLLTGFSKSHHTSYNCRYCLHRFAGCNAQRNHEKHLVECNIHGPQKVSMPVDKPILKFEKYNWQQKVPWIIYADFEAVLPKVTTAFPDSSLSSTTTLALHVSCGFSHVVVGPECTPSKPVTYRGMDATDKFLDRLMAEESVIKEKLSVEKPLQLTFSENLGFLTTRTCYLCGEPFTFDDKRVRDHDHVTGQFLGAAHNSCNLKRRIPQHIPVVIHNLSRYDAHLIMQRIGLIKGPEIKCIPSNSETYISFGLGSLRFVDSFRFLPTSLETLVGNLVKSGRDKFKCLNSVYQPEEVDLLLRKQVYPYDYMDDPKRFDETELPSKEGFYNSLTDESVTELDYEHAKNVWRKFNIRTLGDYHDLYVTSDALLLADVFQEFRSICMAYYELDSAHAYTLPGFSWECALKMTNAKLDLFVDNDMHLFIEKGIPGGVSVISHRLATANNKYMSESYDQTKPSTYITYLDCNNLYGTVMCDALPTRHFRWEVPSLEFTEATILNHPDDHEIGYILEVDLDYPENLHVEHNCYPMAPERRAIKSCELSTYTKELLSDFGIKEKDSLPKLVTDFNPKIKYVVHYRNLKYYVQKGLKIGNVHRILSFRQEPWLKPYIMFNTQKRQMAANEFEKSFFKLLINSVFGKTMENLRNRIDFHLVQTEKRAIKKSSSPAFQKFSIFHNDLVGIHMTKKNLILNRPIYTGFCVLDLSKLLMYKFHYDIIKAQYKDKAKLLFTDTDSLTYLVETPDLYADFALHADNHYDFSDYPPSHALYSANNKKKLGYFKDEMNGAIIAEFCGLRSKMYSMISATGAEKKTAKGVDKTTIKKSVKLEDYKACLVNRARTSAEMKRITSHKHEVFSVRQVKQCLNPSDDKRFILPDGISTLAYGHVDIREQDEII